MNKTLKKEDVVEMSVTIKLNVGKKEIILTDAEARTLQGKLNELFGHNHWYYYQPYQPIVKYPQVYYSTGADGMVSTITKISGSI